MPFFYLSSRPLALSFPLVLSVVVSILFCVFGTGCFLAAPASAQLFDPDPAWPLCGRIADDPPPGWNESQGCPVERWGSAAHTDFPLSDTFGPRQRTSSGGRYDHHRGLDIPADVGTPVFAVAAGVVDKSEADTVQLEHLRPGAATCDDGGCWYSRNIHLSSRAVVVDEVVAKGQLIGHTGDVDTNFPHLHFEIRSAPDFDPESAWQRDCIHPLAVLPYADAGTASTELSLLVDATDPLAPVVDVTTVVPATELDVLRVEVEVWDRAGGAFERVPQPGADADAAGYFAEAPFFDLHQLTFQYSHKDSQTFPWESFDDCPYAADHGPAYDANVHLDQALVGDDSVGDFDGRWITPFDMNMNSSELRWDVRFRSLVGVASADDLCVRVRLRDVLGSERIAEEGCDGLLFTDGFETGDVLRWSASVGSASP